MTRIYTENEAKILGRRLLCNDKGHDLYSGNDLGRWGGVQMQYDRLPNQDIAACDEIKCHVCDVIITVTYPEIGTVVQK